MDIPSSTLPLSRRDIIAPHLLFDTKQAIDMLQCGANEPITKYTIVKDEVEPRVMHIPSPSSEISRNRSRVKPAGSGPGRPLTADRRRPYPCEQCSSRFGSKMELEEHQNSHTGDKPFECDICSARFNRRSTLWNHKRIHSDTKPFSCPICHMTFKWKNSLKCHKEMHERKNESPADIGAPPFDNRLTYATAKRQKGAVDDSITNVSAAISYEVKAANAMKIGVHDGSDGNNNRKPDTPHQGNNGKKRRPSEQNNGRTKKRPRHQHPKTKEIGEQILADAQHNGLNVGEAMHGIDVGGGTLLCGEAVRYDLFKSPDTSVLAQQLYDGHQLLNGQQLLHNINGLTNGVVDGHTLFPQASNFNFVNTAQPEFTTYNLNMVQLPQPIGDLSTQNILSQAALGGNMGPTMFVTPPNTGGGQPQTLSEAINVSQTLYTIQPSTMLTQTPSTPAMNGQSMISPVELMQHQPQISTTCYQSISMPSIGVGAPLTDYTPNVDIAHYTTTGGGLMPFYQTSSHSLGDGTASGAAYNTNDVLGGVSATLPISTSAQMSAVDFVHRVVHPSEY